MDIVLAADISADGKLVALGGPGTIVKVFTVADGKQAYEICAWQFTSASVHMKVTGCGSPIK